MPGAGWRGAAVPRGLEAPLDRQPQRFGHDRSLDAGESRWSHHAPRLAADAGDGIGPSGLLQILRGHHGGRLLQGHERASHVSMEPRGATCAAASDECGAARRWGGRAQPSRDDSERASRLFRKSSGSRFRPASLRGPTRSTTAKHAFDKKTRAGMHDILG
jgi:hypothetical protein